MLDGRNSHNLTLLLLGVKAREIRWKKYKRKIMNDNAWCKISKQNLFSVPTDEKLNMIYVVIGSIAGILLFILIIVGTVTYLK